ncbi:unnamed protein product [Amoebophrya sp. A25]|nr:unnamed protein product [Amoebophrya sp. A25]|eukprot:GSA25T00025439001.1
MMTAVLGIRKLCLLFGFTSITAVHVHPWNENPYEPAAPLEPEHADNDGSGPPKRAFDIFGGNPAKDQVKDNAQQDLDYPSCNCVADCFAMLIPGMPPLVKNYSCEAAEAFQLQEEEGEATDVHKKALSEARYCAVVVNKRGREELTTPARFCAVHCKPPPSHCEGESGCDIGDRCISA